MAAEQQWTIAIAEDRVHIRGGFQTEPKSSRRQQHLVLRRGLLPGLAADGQAGHRGHQLVVEESSEPWGVQEGAEGPQDTAEERQTTRQETKTAKEPSPSLPPPPPLCPSTPWGQCCALCGVLVVGRCPSLVVVKERKIVGSLYGELVSEATKLALVPLFSEGEQSKREQRRYSQYKKLFKQHTRRMHLYYSHLANIVRSALSLIKEDLGERARGGAPVGREGREDQEADAAAGKMENRKSRKENRKEKEAESNTDKEHSTSTTQRQRQRHPSPTPPASSRSSRDIFLLDRQPRAKLDRLIQHKYTYNSNLLNNIIHEVRDPTSFVLLTCGAIQQAYLPSAGGPGLLTVVMRKGRHFVGPRFRKRGIGPSGHVANDVETEVVVYRPYPIHPEGVYASLLMARGSVPALWSQHAALTQATPPFLIAPVHLLDNFRLSVVHLRRLVKEYGNVVLLSLLKASPANKESALSRLYERALRQYNAEMDIIELGEGYKDIPKGVFGCQGLQGLFDVFDEEEEEEKEEKQKKQKSEINETKQKETELERNRIKKSSQRKQKTTTTTTNRTRQPSTSEASHLNHNTEQYSPYNKHHISDIIHLDVSNIKRSVPRWTYDITLRLCLSNIVTLNSFTAFTIAKTTLSIIHLQQSVTRVNCVDCLDRTNDAQMIMTLSQLGPMLSLTHQEPLTLQQFEQPRATQPYIQSPLWVQESRQLSLLAQSKRDLVTRLFKRCGDAVALEYCGSEAHDKSAGANKGKAALLNIQRHLDSNFSAHDEQQAALVFHGLYPPGGERERALSAGLDVWDVVDEAEWMLHVGGETESETETEEETEGVSPSLSPPSSITRDFSLLVQPLGPCALASLGGVAALGPEPDELEFMGMPTAGLRAQPVLPVSAAPSLLLSLSPSASASASEAVADDAGDIGDTGDTGNDGNDGNEADGNGDWALSGSWAERRQRLPGGFGDIDLLPL